MIGPERDDGLPGGPHRADQQHAQAKRDEDMPIGTQRRENRQSSGLVASGIWVLIDGVQAQFGQPCGQDARSHKRGHADAVSASQTVEVNSRGGDKRADEHANAHAATQRGHGPRPEFDRHHLRKVALQRKGENGL